MKKVDMSSEAVSRRLRQVDELRHLCLTLMNAKKASDEKKARDEQENDRNKTK